VALAIGLGRSGGDLGSREAFYDRNTNAFLLRRDWFFAGVLHLGGKWFVVALVVAAAALAIAWWRRPERAATARRLAYVVACFGATTGIAGAWKDLADAVTPWNSTRFGGTVEWPAALPDPAWIDVLGSPGAHAASGFAWVSLYFVGASLGTARRWPWLAPGLGLGLLFALGQHVRGAHAPSHEPWSLAIAWSVAAITAAAFRRAGWLSWSEHVPARDGRTLDRALPWLVGSTVAMAGVAFFAMDQATEHMESSFPGVHERFMVVELVVMTLGLGTAAWLLGDRILGLCEREASRVEAERERRFQVLGRMAASVAHEVRNPLQTLRLIVDEQRHDVPGLRKHALVPEFEACLERIDRAVDLVYRLARPETGNPDGADLAATAREAITALTRILQDRVTFAWESEPPTAPVASSRTALRIVLDNLLRNAAEASPAGGTVGLGLEPRGAQWSLSIKNRGTLTRRAGAAAKEPGLGLGVPISRQIAGNAGGAIELTEADGHVICTLSWPRSTGVAA
jgi:membrane-associated PAP2 superfamily phosphatase/signal transduction histidine kinase